MGIRYLYGGVSNCWAVLCLPAYGWLIHLMVVEAMARRATQKQMTIEELKAFIHSQPYRGRLVDVGVPIVKVEKPKTKQK